MTKKLHKLFTLFLAVAVFFTYLPAASMLGADTNAYAASYAGTLKQHDTGQKLSGKTVEIWVARATSNTKLQNVELEYGPCVEAADGGSFHKYEIDTGKKDILVYCVEHGVVQRSDKLKSVIENNSYYAKAYENKGHAQSIENMKKVLMFAPTTGSDFGELRDLGYTGSGNLNDWIAASQALIWECGQLMREDKNFTLSASGLYYRSSYQGERTKKIPKTHYYNCLDKTAQAIYKFMVREIKKYEHFDASIASTDKSKPKQLAIAEDATFPVTLEIASGSYGDDLYLAEETESGKVKKLSSKIAELKYDKTKKTYSIVVKTEEALNKTIMVKHDGAAAKRAEAKFKEDKNLYKMYFWEHKTTNGHTQGMISGLEDPVTGYLTLIKGTVSESTPPEGDCTPKDVEYFPTFKFPVSKIDENGGWDDNENTPMGDAYLDATYTLERNIAGKGWETVDTATLDEYGNEETLMDQPFITKEDLEEFKTDSGSISGCPHKTKTGVAHPGSKSPAKREWDVTIQYRITETRPDGRYIDPDRYGGVREYSVHYYAMTEDTCQYYCDSLPWTDVEYTVEYSVTKGDGATYTLGPTTDPWTDPLNLDGDCLSYDTEIFVNDCFRGDLQLIKSNEKEDPFKDNSEGASDLNISQKSMWAIRLVSGGLENSEYIHLVSGEPEVLTGGTYQYTASRDSGSYTADREHPISVGTNGTLIVKDLPYGRYEVIEVSADDPMYVLEHGFVDVGEHNGNNGQKVAESGLFSGYDKSGTNQIGSAANGTGDYWNNRYDANIRDKVKSNKIKVVKVDSETGKTVRLAGTKVFIRYKGNPDYSDEENQKRYGESGTEVRGIYNRFLPNAERIDAESQNYTFELDENGECIIPYELPYGRYEILEWLLPDGYYVGEYGQDGVAKNHNFGYIKEGQLTVDYDKHGYGATVEQFGIYDSKGNHVKYQDKDKYSFEKLSEMVTNRYTFDVTKQEDHVDGYYFQKVEYDGTRSENDPSYDKTQYPYTKYYKVSAVINNSVKGKIEIEKKGEALVGFKKSEKDGKTIFEPVFEMVADLKDAVFGLFAAKDETLNDGSEGPKIYDSKTDEEITIPKEKSSHLSSIVESVKAFFGKLVNPKSYEAANYETGSYEHASGGKLWYMLERAVSEGNVKRTLYLSPEQKDSTYTYAYEASDDVYNYRWDVEVTLKNQANGRNVTKVNVTKTTSVKNGFTADIPTTHMTGSVGDTVLDPIQSYLAGDELDWSRQSSLSVDDRTYVFEADGGELVYSDGTGHQDDVYLFGDDTAVDFSKYCPQRYLVKQYTAYKLTKEDLVKEERSIGTRQEIDIPGLDKNGDGDYDDEGDVAPTYKTVEEKAVRTKFEWDNNCVFKEEAKVGAKAYVTMNETGEEKLAATGYYAGGEYTPFDEKYTLVSADENGTEKAAYTVPQGWTLSEFTGNPKEDPHYIMIEKTDEETGKLVRRILLSDLSAWQECDEAGNFKKAVVQVYEVEYTQEPEDANGFTAQWDGFAIAAGVDQETGVAVTNITKQNSAISESVEVGLGYEKETDGDMTTFRTIPISAPLYFKWTDGIRTEMFYRGGVCKTTITIPQSAVDHGYKEVIPSLNYVKTDAEGKKALTNLNWYELLSPENPQVEFNENTGLANGMLVIAKAHYTTKAGEEAYYTIEITTNQKEDEALRLVFADGYSMDIYCADTASGNGVGVLDLYNVYKTNRYTASQMIQTLTTVGGKASSQLLPLGKYILRELASDDNYLNDASEQVIELTYKDQFTPLIWGKGSFENKYFETQLDLSKVFETAFKSEDYQKPKEGQTVKFGLYAAEEIKAEKEGILKVFAKSIKKDTLMDVISVTYQDGGEVLVNTKLPEGKYYLKEIEAPSDYQLSDIKYHFEVKEDESDYSDEARFDYVNHDGIYGNFVLEEKNRVKTTVMVEARLPMPNITIDGASYALDTDFESEDGKIKIAVNTDYTKVTVDTAGGEETKITLPNGKALSVKLAESGNAFDYTVDGVASTFTPRGTYTGYYAGYEELWTPIAGEDLTTYSPQFTLTGAGTDKAEVILSATVTHTPSVTVTTKEELVDPEKPELGFTTVDVTKGNLTPKGNQIFKHSAVLTVKNASGENVIKETFRRTSSGKTVTETLDASGEIVLNPKDTLTLNTNSGALVTVSMDKYGVVSAKIENVLSGLFTEDAHAEATTTGKFNVKESFEFAKNVTLGRQDTSADKLMIKLNSDNRDSFAVENDHVPEVHFEKVDKDNPSTKLAGAVFEIWSAKPSGEWTVEPDEKLGTYTTDAKGQFVAELDYGTYFWKEVKAPAGYSAEDSDYHSFRIIKGVPNYQFTIANVKTPGGGGGGGGSSYQIEIKKVDKETRQSLAGAEFELWSSKLSEDGKTLLPDKKLLTKNLVTGKYGLVSVSVSHTGKFFYREVKAPTGYKADSDFHLIDTTTLGLIARVEVENEPTDEPQEPEKPEKPEKPDKPDKPDKPNKPIKQRIQEDVPKTGDSMQLYVLLVFLILSLLGLLSCKSARK